MGPQQGAEAIDWFNLKSGECKSISALAEEDGSTAPYICKVIQLAFLSPELLHRIRLVNIRRSSMPNDSSRNFPCHSIGLSKEKLWVLIFKDECSQAKIRRSGLPVTSLDIKYKLRKGS